MTIRVFALNDMFLKRLSSLYVVIKYFLTFIYVISSSGVLSLDTNTISKGSPLEVRSWIKMALLAGKALSNVKDDIKISCALNV